MRRLAQASLSELAPIRATAVLRPGRASRRHGPYRRRRLPSLSSGRIHRRHAGSAIRPLGRDRNQPLSAGPRRAARAAGPSLLPHLEAGRAGRDPDRRLHPAHLDVLDAASDGGGDPCARVAFVARGDDDRHRKRLRARSRLRRARHGQSPIARGPPRALRRRAPCSGSLRWRWSAAARRMRRRSTLVSCDNVPSNGPLLRSALVAFAAARSAPLARWIEEQRRVSVLDGRPDRAGRDARRISIASRSTSA